jgi:hypothetical protein
MMEHDWQSYFVLAMLFCTILLLIGVALPPEVQKCVCNCPGGYDSSNRWDARNIPDRAPGNLNLTPLYKEI